MRGGERDERSRFFSNKPAAYRARVELCGRAVENRLGHGRAQTGKNASGSWPPGHHDAGLFSVDPGDCGQGHKDPQVATKEGLVRPTKILPAAVVL